MKSPKAELHVCLGCGRDTSAPSCVCKRCVKEADEKEFIPVKLTDIEQDAIDNFVGTKGEVWEKPKAKKERPTC